MVHNGIEYIDMQLICEAYTLMQNLLGMKPDELGKVFAEWNEGDLDSYLIQITADILQQRDPVNKRRLPRRLRPRHRRPEGHRASGRASTRSTWASPPTRSPRRSSRAASRALKDERVAATKVLKGPRRAVSRHRRPSSIEAIRDALYCSKICAYAQGFQLMREAQKEYKWKLNFGEIAAIWRGGCIIRARFLQKITEAYARNPKLVNLLLDPYFNEQIAEGPGRLAQGRRARGRHGVAAPAFMRALAYYDGYRSARLPANLLQAQRDYFGAHTYERIDEPRGKFFHLDWPDPKRPQHPA